LLRELKANGIKLILVSNKPDEATQSVVNHFFGGFFDRVSGAVDEFPLKPDPSLAKSILNDFSISPEECAWIGDTSTDMKTGKNLGVALNIGVLWGFRKREELESSGADVIVEKVSEILTEVKRIV
jgi:phosphoglycolate phosphatase